MNSMRKLLVCVAGVIVIVAPGVAQTVPDWQTAAGGKKEFEVASVRPDTGPFKPPSFAFSADDSFVQTGGLVHADFSLSTYITFAYKLWPSDEQMTAMLAPLPKWVSTDRFQIEARTDANATKDQMRLMMQSLLANRFGLKVHFEMHEVPVFAMMLSKPGRLGPKLHPHAEGPACDVALPPVVKGAPPNLDIFPWSCGENGMTQLPNHDLLMGSRDTTMELIGDALPSLGKLGRPVVDHTGLSGRFDFQVEFSMEATNAKPDAEGTPFLEAAKEQLGIKLEPAKAQLETIVVDHVERPSEN